MVNRPGMSIRRLMPHRRAGSDSSEILEEGSPDEYDFYLRNNTVPQQSHMRQSMRAKAPPAPITIRKGSTYSRSMSPLPPLPAENTHSASSSVSSIDSQDVFWTANKKAAAVLGLPESAVAPAARTGLPRRPNRPGNGYLGSSSKEQTTQPPKSAVARTMAEASRPLSPRTVPDGSRSVSPRPSNATQESLVPPSPKQTSQSTLIAEVEDTNSPRLSVTMTAPSTEPIAELDSPDQSVPARKPLATGQRKEEWSDNVRQLIQETDQAFKAVGSALADAKLASYTFERAESPVSPTAMPAALNIPKELPPLPPTPPIELDSPELPSPDQTLQPPPLTPARPVSTLVVPTPPTSAPAKVSPVSPSRPKDRKTRPRRNKGWPSVSQAMAARLGLSDNVTDILTGQRFKRIEADEMLTTDQIEELKRIREETRKQANLLLQSRPSSESERRPSSVYELSSEMVDEIKEGAAKQSESSGTEESEEDDDFEENAMWERKFRSVSVSAPPTPPRSAPRGFSVSESTYKASVSEGADFVEEPIAEEPELEQSEPEKVQRVRQPLDILRSEEDERFIYLKSTPYTLNTPMFRHGPITFSKSEVSKMLMKVDDTLDWTAFQMAIMGGAGGDIMGGFYDEGDEQDRDIADDVASWFDTLGFESAGELVDSNSRSGRDSAGSMSSSYSSVNPNDMEFAMPTVNDYPLQPAENTYDTNKFFRGSGLPRWSTASKRFGSEDAAQMIPSDPIVVCGPGGEGDIDASVADSGVPMYGSLGDDLGDFLRWEAEQMCFYGAARV